MSTSLGRSSEGAEDPYDPEAATPYPQPTRRAARRGAWILGGILTCLVCSGVLWWTLTFDQQTSTEDSVYALILFRRHQPRIVFETQPRLTTEEWIAYRNGQSQFITSPMLLASVLRKVAVSRINLVKQQKEPIAWLRSKLDVSFPGDSDIMRIAFRGPKSHDAVEILRAVVEAYQTEVVMAREADLDRRIDKLERIRTDLETELRQSRITLRTLLESGGANPFRPTEAQLLQIYQEQIRSLVTSTKDKTHLEELTRQLQEAEAKDAAVPDAEVEAELASENELLKAIAQKDLIHELFENGTLNLQPDESALIKYRTGVAATAKILESYGTEMRPRVIDRLRIRRRTALRNEIAQLKRSIAASEAQIARLEKLWLESRQIGQISVEVDDISHKVRVKEDILNAVERELGIQKIERQAGTDTLLIHLPVIDNYQSIE